MWSDIEMIQRYFQIQEDLIEDQKTTNKAHIYPFIDNVEPNPITTKKIRELYDKHKDHVKPCCGVLN